MDLFVLQHTHVLDEDQEDVKFIGVYSSRNAAEMAIARLKLQPGFRDAPEGFTIDRYTLDEDNWTEGYITIRHERDGEENVEANVPSH